MWREVFKDSKCKQCNTDKNLTIDHIKALRDGGTNDIINLQILCKECHTLKDKYITKCRRY